MNLHIPGALTRLTDANIPAFLAENPGVISRESQNVPGLTWYGHETNGRSIARFLILAFHQAPPENT